MPDGEIDGEKRATLQRFAALAVALPVLNDGERSKSSENGTGKVRRALVGYITSHPGTHFSKIRDDLHLATGEAQYHLNYLASDGEIESIRDGEFRRFFIASEFTDRERVLLGYLRRETLCRLLIAVLKMPDATGRELATEIGVSPSTVSSYATQMTERGIFAEGDGYELSEPERLITLLIRFGPTLGRDATSFGREATEYIQYSPA